MPPWVTRLSRAVVVFALGGWLTGVVLLSTNDDTTVLTALWTIEALRAGFAGVLMGLSLGSLLAWLQPPVWAGPLSGTMASLGGVYTYFWLWPHDWQPTRFEAWKSLAAVVDVYWPYLLPGAVFAGLLTHVWLRRPTALAAWEQVGEHTEQPPDRPASG